MSAARGHVPLLSLRGFLRIWQRLGQYDAEERCRMEDWEFVALLKHQHRCSC